MRISKDWLSQWVDLPSNITELMCEYSVETASVPNPAFIDPLVIVGRVSEVTQHPNADKLRVTKVDIGQDKVLSIVCGCPTVCEGMVVPVACIGAQLPGGKIKKSKLRQVSSEGMLCSLSDLGLADKSSGLYAMDKSAPIGVSFSDCYGWLPELYDIEITPNRGDCFSVLGIAREIRAITGHEIRQPTYSKISTKNTHQTHECPVFGSLKITGFRDQPLPAFMIFRLKSAGIQSVHPIVDILNYVMLETGQPMHAYDLLKLKGPLKTHILTKDQTFKALNGREYALIAGDLVVSDQQQTQAIAGIMGSEQSMVDSKTQAVILEAAHFDRDLVRATSGRLHLHTDSSIRFARFVDPTLPAMALQYAADLMVRYLDATIEDSIDINEYEYVPPVVHLCTDHLNNVLGTSFSEKVVMEILERLCIPCIAPNEFQIPSHRMNDLCHQHDLIEEVIRIHGFNQLPKTPLVLQVQAEVPVFFNRREAIKQGLVAQGYQEIVTYAFTSLHQLRSFDHQEASLVQLSNPISSEYEYMRQSLLPSIIQVAADHLRAGQVDIQLMEIGKRYFSNKEVLSLALCCVFDSQQTADEGFSKISQHLVQVLTHPCQFSCHENQGFHPGVSAQIMYQNKPLGVVGQLHPKMSQQLFDGKMVMLCQVDLLDCYQHSQYQPYSRFPKIKRDIAYLVESQMPYEKIKTIITNLRIKNLLNFDVFDIYPIKASNRVSLAIRYVFASNESSMTDEQVQKRLSKINECLLEELSITVR